MPYQVTGNTVRGEPSQIQQREGISVFTDRSLAEQFQRELKKGGYNRADIIEVDVPKELDTITAPANSSDRGVTTKPSSTVQYNEITGTYQPNNISLQQQQSNFFEKQAELRRARGVYTPEELEQVKEQEKAKGISETYAKQADILSKTTPIPEARADEVLKTLRTFPSQFQNPETQRAISEAAIQKRNVLAADAGIKELERQNDTRVSSGLFDRNLVARDTPIFLNQVGISENQGTYSKAPQPEGKLETLYSFLSEKTGEFEKKKATVGVTKSEQIRETLRGFGISLVGTGLFFKSLATQPKKTIIQTGTGLKEAGRRLGGGGFPELGEKLRSNPEGSLGFILGEVAQAKAGGTILTESSNLLKQGFTVVDPRFRLVRTTPFGEQIIKNIPTADKSLIEIGLIPQGSKPKLNVNPIRAAQESNIPFRPEASFPILSSTESKLLNLARQEGAAVTGSFGQKILVQGSRPYADIDIVTQDTAAFAQKAQQAIPETTIKKVSITDSPLGKFDIYRVTDRSGKVIADIDPRKFAEEQYITKLETRTGQGSILDVQGLQVVSPRVRLAAKTAQLGRVPLQSPKGQKVIKDINILTGGEFQESPLLRGGFGYTQEEQAAFIGKTGVVTTSARDLFGILKKEVPIEPGESGMGLFATPFDINKPNRGLTRVSRLGVKTKDAEFLDILYGDVTLKGSKPQIVFFPEETIGKTFQPFGYPSSELEVTLPAGNVIRKVKTNAVTLIEGKRVPIIQAEVLGQDELNKISNLGLGDDVAAARKGELSESKIKILESKIKTATGQDVEFSRPVNQKPQVRPSRLLGNVLGSVTSPVRQSIETRSTILVGVSGEVLRESGSTSTMQSKAPESNMFISRTVQPSGDFFSSTITPRTSTPSLDIPTRSPPSRSPPSRLTPTYTAPPYYTPPYKSPPYYSPHSAPPSRTPPTRPPNQTRNKQTYALTPNEQKAYDVLIKIKQAKQRKKQYRSLGYKKANTEPLSEQAAFGLGAGIVDKYANRSFVVKKTSGVPAYRPDLEAQANALRDKIRQSKKNASIFVEKSKYAIDSLQEKLAIPYESVRQRKQKLVNQINLFKQRQATNFLTTSKKKGKKSKQGAWFD